MLQNYLTLQMYNLMTNAIINKLDKCKYERHLQRVYIIKNKRKEDFWCINLRKHIK